MQRKFYIDFDLLFDSISATAFGRGYMVPTSQFFEGFMCSSLLHFIDVSNNTYLDLADQMYTCIKTSMCVRFSAVVKAQ